MISIIILCFFTLSLAAPKPVLYCNDTVWTESTVTGVFPDADSFKACSKPSLTKNVKISADDWSAVECSGAGDTSNSRGSCEKKNIEVPASCDSPTSCKEATFNDVTTCAGSAADANPFTASCDNAKCKDCILLTCGLNACGELTASTTNKASNETVIKCVGDEACTPNADLDVHTIDCDGEKACYQAKKLKAENIECDGVNACSESDAISIQETLKCVGESACRKSTIKIAKNKGQVHCDGPVDGVVGTALATMSAAMSEMTEANLDAFVKDTANAKLIADTFGGVTTAGGFTGTSCSEATIKFSNLFLNEGDTTCEGAGSCYKATLNTPTRCHGIFSCYGAQMGDDFQCRDSDFDCYGTTILKGSGVICCGAGCNVAGKAESGDGCTLEADKTKFNVESTVDGETVSTPTEFDCKQCGKKSLFFLATSSKTAMIVAIVICLLLLGVAVGVLLFFKDKIFGGAAEEEV